MRRKAFVLAGSLLCAAGACHAGTVANDASPLGTAITTHSGNIFTIAPAGNKNNIAGSNLFYSLSLLNLDKGETANFTGPPTITNILTRVTGGPSSIDGKLQSSIPGASFLLIDSAGVIFGPDSSLDVKGSFAVTTADVVHLSDGGKLLANPARASVLTTAPPSAFGFLSPHLAAVTINGGAITTDVNGVTHLHPTLNSAPGGAMSIVAGNVTLNGGEIATPDASALTVVSVASPGTVKLSQPGDISSFSMLGTIKIANGGFLGSDASSSAGADSGPVNVTAGHVIVRGSDPTGAVQSSLGSVAGAGNAGLGKAGSVAVLADTIRVLAGATITSNGFAGADSGTVTLASNTLFISGADTNGGESRVFSVAGTGNAGALTVNVKGALTLDGGGIFSSAQAGNDGGDVSLAAGSLAITHDGFIASIGGFDRAGNVNVAVAGAAFVNGSIESDGSPGNDGGNLTLTAGSLSIVGKPTDFGRPTDDAIGSIAGAGVAGNVRVSVTGALNVSNGASIVSDAQKEGTDAGSVMVRAGVLSLTGTTRLSEVQGEIASAGGSGVAGDVRVLCSGPLMVSTLANIISDATSGTDAGNVTIHAGSIAVTGDPNALGLTEISSTSGTGAAGNVNIAASGAIRVTGQVNIGSGGDSGTGAGAVTLTGGSLLLRNSSISSDAGNGEAGAVTVTTRGAITLANRGTIVSRADSTGDAGNVSVSAGGLSLSTGGSILSDAPTGFNAGIVRLTARNILLDGAGSPHSTGILASGELPPGADADVIVTAAELTVRNSASILADSYGATTAGSIAITLSDAAVLQSGGSITANSYTGGNGGNIELNAETLDLSGGSIGASNYFGVLDAGHVDINAQTVSLDNGSSISATAGGGLADNLRLHVVFGHGEGGGANVFLVSPTGVAIQVEDSAESGIIGDSGNADFFPLEGHFATYVARDLNGPWTLEVQPNTQSHDVGSVTLKQWSLTLGGKTIGSSTTPVSGTSFNSSLLVSGADPGLTGGQGGDVNLTAQHLTVGAGSSISTNTFGTGPAGSVNLQSSSLLLHDGGQIASAALSPPGGGAAPGNAGSIIVSVMGTAQLQSGARMLVSSENADAGTISFSTGADLDVFSSRISATAGGNGGSVHLNAPGTIVILNSQLSAAAGGTGGNVIIDPALVVLDQSTLAANAAIGNGGNVTLTTQEFLRSDSVINVSSMFGVAGTVLVSSPDQEIAGTLVALRADLADPGITLQPTCTQMAGSTESSFVITGTGGLPASPGGWLLNSGGK